MTVLYDLNNNSITMIANLLNKKNLISLAQTSTQMKYQTKRALKSQEKKQKAVKQIQKSYRSSQERLFKKILNNGVNLVNTMISHNHIPFNIQEELTSNVLNQYTTKLSQRQKTLILKELVDYMFYKSLGRKSRSNDKRIQYIMKTSYKKGLEDLHELVFEYKRHFL